MCDYSLHDVASRKAEVGDTLMLRKFGRHQVTGFGRLEDGPTCVTCIPHGTKLEVVRKEKDVAVAIFGHNDKGDWRDGIIFADDPNAIFSLQGLPLGLMARVVALPVAKPPAPVERKPTILQGIRQLVFPG